MLGTWFARTCKSGSEMVTTTPIRKLSRTISHNFRELAIFAPACSPMGVMAASAPRVKNPMPTIRSAAPTRNANKMSTGSGAKEKHNTSTITVMGSTEASASRTFSPRTVFVRPTLSLHRLMLTTRSPPANFIIILPQKSSLLQGNAGFLYVSFTCLPDFQTRIHQIFSSMSQTRLPRFPRETGPPRPSGISG